MNVTRIVAAFVAAGLVAGSAMAQTKTAAPVAANDDTLLKEGTILYGGNIGWTLANANYGGSIVKNNSLSISPEVNYFVMDNLSVGLEASVNWKRQKNWWAGEVDNSTELIGELVGRYYMPLCNNKIVPYVGATLGGGYGMYSWRASGVSDHNDAYLTTYGAQTGFLVPLNANVMLDTRIAYKRINRQGDFWTMNYDSLAKNEGDVLMTIGFLMKY